MTRQRSAHVQRSAYVIDELDGDEGVAHCDLATRCAQPHAGVKMRGGTKFKEPAAGDAGSGRAHRWTLTGSATLGPGNTIETYPHSTTPSGNSGTAAVVRRNIFENLQGISKEMSDQPKVRLKLAS